MMQQLSRNQKSVAAFRMMCDIGSFDAFIPPKASDEEEALICRLISSVDRLTPSDRDRKITQVYGDLELLQSSEAAAGIQFRMIEVQCKKISVGFLLDKAFFYLRVCLKIDWPKLLHKTVGVKISPNEQIVVHYPKILEQIQSLVATTEKRCIRRVKK